jgi:hypothetical protein
MKLIHTGPSPHSGHKIDKFIRCPQLYAYAELMHPTPVPRMESPALIKGSLGHVGLAHYYRRKQALAQGEDLNQWWEPMRAIEERGTKEGGSWPDFISLAQTTVAAYIREMDGQNIEVVGVEDNLQTEVTFQRQKWPLTRSADLIVKVGAVHRIIDHKFVGRLNSRTVMRYALSGQFLDYAILGREKWGDGFDGAWINFIEWPTGGATPTLRQVRAPSAPHAVAARANQLSMAYAGRAELERREVDPWDYPKRLHEQICNSPYGVCDAVELCRWGKIASPVEEK